MKTICGRGSDLLFMTLYGEAMFRQRYRVFHERLQWDVQVERGIEIDRFDGVDAVYVLALDEHDRLLGSWRLRPTTGPYMLREVFPQLLGDAQPPMSRSIWEISRCAVECCNARHAAAAAVGDVFKALMAETSRFCFANSIEQLVVVTSLAVKKLLDGAGLEPRPFSPAIRIGNVWSVALVLGRVEKLREVVASLESGHDPATGHRAALG